MEPTLSEIRIFAGNFAPRGWQFCNGALMSIAENTALFSLIGTVYGGDGQTTFALPDLRGRIPVGTGAGPGIGTWDLGEVQGSETNTMTSANMPGHNHVASGHLNVATAGATANAPTGNYFASAAGRDTTNGQSVQVNVYDSATTASGGPNGVTVTLGPTGSNVPFNNIQPSLALNYIIAVEGIFPSRS